MYAPRILAYIVESSLIHWFFPVLSDSLREAGSQGF